ncbi:conserved hypothetical protein, DegV family [Alteracholeplasma palmae J233]|uniref:DegV family protein n=1 Tax=Alteracholeplasma palmae (strain ATCC 49389 / J233) TaxID=1318466 RepID=U4KP09_ALTPJ|nr:DegV family protein [Alteracholeplasma palmae]CCV63930.1 conserved hypothetical protein, DegV family [Alteracholeplasma palmae J233]
MIKVVVDSTSDLKPEYLKENDIKMIPLQVFVEGKEYLDKTNIDVKEVYQYIRENKNIKTSLPRYQDLYEVFESYAKINQPFIFFAFSKEMSGTYNAAHTVLAEIKEIYPDAKIAIIDSKTGSLSSSIIVFKLVDKIKAGASFDEAVDYANKLTYETGFIFMVNDLSQLVKGGRVSKVKALVSNVLKIHPILKIEEGKINNFKNVIGYKRTITELIKEAKKMIQDTSQTIYISYADNAELAYEVRDLLEKELGCKDFYFDAIGSVFAAHLGLGSVGISFFK